MSKVQGGANKKMKKFPRILNYLEVHHKEIYEIIDDLAMQGSLTPKRGGSITFLLPDKKLITKIEKAIESNNPEEATDIVLSLILYDLFEKPSDFTDKQDDIPNALGKKLMVKSVSGNKVLIDNGELVIDTGFKPFERQGNSKRGNLAVWKLTGEVEYEKAPKATFKYLKTTKKPSAVKEGGGSDESRLCEIVKSVEDQECDAIKKFMPSSGRQFISPMFNAVCAVLRSFEAGKDGEYCDEYKFARSLITQYPVCDFYLIFKCPRLFCCEKVYSAYTNGIKMDNNVDFIRQFCQKGDVSDGLLLSVNGMNQVNIERDKVRNSLLNRIDKSISSKIVKAYTDVDNTNCLGSAKNVYPEKLAAMFKSCPGMHLTIDESMFIIYSLMMNLKDIPSMDRMKKSNEFHFNIIAHARAIKDFSDPRISLILKDGLSTQISSEQIYTYLVEFWKTFGIHVPCNLEEQYKDRLRTGGDDDDDDERSPYSKDLIDVGSNINHELSKYDNAEMQMSMPAINELKAYMKKNNGKIPDMSNY